MGSRFGGLKQMAGVGPGGETLLDYAVHDALAAGFGKIVFVIRRDFEEAFRAEVVGRLPPGVPVELVFQELTDLPVGCRATAERTRPWGTGQAVLAAQSAVREPFAVINADDFYGADAYRQAADFVARVQLAAWPMPFGLVAFELGRTLSPHGTVSRGVCAVGEDGALAELTETTGLRRTDDGNVEAANGVLEGLCETTPVSMNFFVFVPEVFPFLETQFREFLVAYGEDAKAEFYLPSAVTRMIARNQAQVAVMRSSGEWMGVTYAEDRPEVEARLRALHEGGNYPSPLW